VGKLDLLRVHIEDHLFGHPFGEDTGLVTQGALRIGMDKVKHGIPLHLQDGIETTMQMHSHSNGNRVERGIKAVKISAGMAGKCRRNITPA
jgi:hypothetical protein